MADVTARRETRERRRDESPSSLHNAAPSVTSVLTLEALGDSLYTMDNRMPCHTATGRQLQAHMLYSYEGSSETSVFPNAQRRFFWPRS